MEQGVDQGAVGAAGAGVDDEAGGFVDGDQVVVFVEDVERDVFGFGGGQRRPRDDAEFEAFAAAQAEAGTKDGFAIEGGVAFADELLETGAAELGELSGKEVVEALVAGVGGHDEAGDASGHGRARWPAGGAGRTRRRRQR
jgi:hypothetical protein